jgi:hypothetical protein
MHRQQQNQEKIRVMIPNNLIQQLAAVNNSGKSVTAQINELIINRIAQDDATDENNKK